MKHYYGLTRLLLALLILAQLSCAAQSPLEPIPDDARVQVRIEGSGEPGEAVNDDQFVLGAAATGAAAGAVVGTLAGLSCGPFFYFCAPLAASAGMAIGFVAGGIFGAASAINRDEQEAFRAILEASFSSSRPQAFLEGSFRNQAARRWLLVDHMPERIIDLRLDDFRVIQHSPDRFSLGLSGSFTVFAPAAPEQKLRRYRFEQVTPARELDYFLDETGNNFRAEFARGIDSLANQMLSAL